MSSASQPLEFFFDRSLGRQTAYALRANGWTVHLIADHYAEDAQKVADEEWIAEGASRGWVLLSKDKRIRYRGPELAALHQGRLFCLANGNLRISEMVNRFVVAGPSLRRQAEEHPVGFWKIYGKGEIRRTWP